MIRRKIKNVIQSFGPFIYGGQLIYTNETLDLSELGFEVVRLNDSGPAEELLTDELEEMDGYIDNGSRLGGREITLGVFFEAWTYQDAELRKSELESLFKRRQLFHFRTKAKPGKQIKVRKVGAIEMEDLGGHIFDATITLAAPSPYWESIRNAFDPITVDDDMAAGLGYNLEEESDQKTTDSQPIIFNPGDARIDPRNVHTPFKMILRGASSNIKITNQENGSSVQVFTSTVTGDSLTFDGVRITRNGTSVFGLSDHGVIILERGRNQLTIQGKNSTAEIEFIAKAHYLK